MTDHFTQSVLDELENAIGRAGLERVVAAFLDELAGLKEQFEGFGDSNDSDTVSRCAHTLKSISGTFGAIELQRVSQSLEEAFRLGQTNVLSEHKSDILNLIDEALDHFTPIKPE